MKIGRQYVGKMVEFMWKDPNNNRVTKARALRGLAALATWRERGVIDDITEGVVRIAHSEAAGPRNPAEPDEFVYSWVPEGLITEITVYEPVSQEGGETSGQSKSEA